MSKKMIIDNAGNEIMSEKAGILCGLAFLFLILVIGYNVFAMKVPGETWKIYPTKVELVHADIGVESRGQKVRAYKVTTKTNWFVMNYGYDFKSAFEGGQTFYLSESKGVFKILKLCAGNPSTPDALICREIKFDKRTSRNSGDRIDE